MRPPQFAGESRVRVAHDVQHAHASMRPPQFAGESLAADLLPNGRLMLQ